MIIDSVNVLQFLKKYDDKFSFDGVNVGLKDYRSSQANVAAAKNTGQMQDNTHTQSQENTSFKRYALSCFCQSESKFEFYHFDLSTV